ncbi:hypothetical protein B0H13DRAFT_1862766 [Mycena leptocephala]|nr:hypothetical protein B0H13DRAFT_1862766 [Mycena leptocephala]
MRIIEDNLWTELVASSLYTNSTIYRASLSDHHQFLRALRLFLSPYALRSFPPGVPAQLVVLVPEIPLLVPGFSRETPLSFQVLWHQIQYAGYRHRLQVEKPHPPPLTIHDPYPPVRTVVTPPVVHLVPRTDPAPRRPYTAPSVAIGRAPSNSVSSSRSRADSIEPNTPKSPKTPEDPAQIRRGSLLTLSDADPFAARVVSVHSPTDPNRLSAFSNSSVKDTKSDESANRVSYASSSSLSHSFRLGGDLSPRSIVSPVSESGSLSYMKLSNKLSGPSLRRRDVSGDSWFGGDNRLSQPDAPPNPRPIMRARGMTESGIERTNFLRNDSFGSRPAPSPKSHSPTARQIPVSRPPPPSSELPLPPNSTDDRALGGHSAGSASTSSLTFSAEFSPISPRTRGNSKLPRKQRSFQQHRVPVPAIPLQLPLSEQRASDPILSARKRLFSTSSSRRPSQSTLALNDDARSLNTAPEPEQTASNLASCWIDTDLQPPRSPTSTTHEYTPQQIMSPAEMLQVEASVEAAYKRPRADSVLSASTGMSDFDLNDFGLSLAGASFGGGGGTDMYYHQPLAPQPPSPPILMSLPPPPRRTASRPSSLLRSHSELVTPLSPAPRRNLRPKVSVEERMHRQSIMRKPSFLDIEDEMDKDPPPRYRARRAS